MAIFKAPLQSLPQLATTVRDARTTARLSQTELARQTGIPRPWINQLETGKLSEPGFVRVLKVCDALSITLTAAYAVPDSASSGTGTDTDNGDETTQTQNVTTPVKHAQNRSRNQTETQRSAQDTSLANLHHFLNSINRSAAALKHQAQELDGPEL